MNRLPLVVSFYTLDTPYEEEVQGLISSCKRFNIEHEIEGIGSTGSWEMNCAFKPLFLLKKVEELKRPLLWVDADAAFMRSPPILDVFSLDLAVRLYDCSNDHPSRVVSSAVFVNSSEKSKEILRAWAGKCLSWLKEKERREVWDQDALRSVIFEEKYKDCWGVFPKFYSVIEGHPEDVVYKDPVIAQYQASRRFKRWINHPEERAW
jgi:hypothetical protein